MTTPENPDDVLALREALEALVEAIDYCHKTRHLRHADQPKGLRMAGPDCYCSVNESMSLARRALAAVRAETLAGSGVVEAGGPHDPDDGDCRCLRCWYDASDLPMQPATPPETLAGSGECGFVRDGFRCNDTPIQHRYVCGVLHGHTMVCHPFQPATPPTPPTPALTAARLADVERVLRRIVTHAQDRGDFPGDWYEVSGGAIGAARDLLAALATSPAPAAEDHR